MTHIYYREGLWKKIGDKKCEGPKAIKPGDNVNLCWKFSGN